MTKKIYIYTGKIKSGKTTNLFRWLASQRNVAGILQPVIEQKRFLYSIVDKTIIQFEVSDRDAKELNADDIIKIGKYNFLKTGFEKAQNILKRDFNEPYDWLVIDEIGPLELNGTGLEPTVSEIISAKEEFHGHIIVVVRDEILSSFLTYYKINNDYEFFEINYKSDL